MTVQVSTKVPNEQVIALLNHSVQREIDYMLIGLRKTEDRIRQFQDVYGAKSPDKVKNIPPLDRVEWEGEKMTLDKLKEKIAILKSVQFS